MFTNLSDHGGDFRDILDNKFPKSKNVCIATGYASLDVLYSYKSSFLEIANNGGISKLLLGMAFYEGLSSKKLEAANSLNEQLKMFNNSSGVYVAIGRRYHGKVYCFDQGTDKNIYVGSSNFSSSGTRGNIECIIPVTNKLQKRSVTKFLNDLYSPSYSITIDKAEIPVPGKKKVVLPTVENLWNSLKKYDPTTINTALFPKFEFPLERVVEMEKSNLNVYFGKGRLNSSNGKITPRPWYEIELISSNDLSSQLYYPKGDFLAYTDDGYIIPMRTQGDYYKNIRTRYSLQIFGMWLKGKLEQSGALSKYEPVTLDTLEEYGNNKLVFYKIDEGKYYMTF